MPLILVNADIDFLGSDKKMNEIVDEIEDDKERPVIFYSFDSQEKLEIRRHPASRLFYKSDVGFVKMPVELIELKNFTIFWFPAKKSPILRLKLFCLWVLRSIWLIFFCMISVILI